MCKGGIISDSFSKWLRSSKQKFQITILIIFSLDGYLVLWMGAQDSYSAPFWFFLEIWSKEKTFWDEATFSKIS